MRRTSATIFLFFLAVAAEISFSACSIQKSDGRTVVENNSGSVLNLENSYGYETTAAAYYSCAMVAGEPDFLKEPFEVIATPYDATKFTTLLNNHSTPASIIVYSVDEKVLKGTPTTIYTYCNVASVSSYPDGHSNPMTAKQIQRAARVGVEQISHLLDQARL